MEGGVGGAPACLQLVSSSSTTQSAAGPPALLTRSSSQVLAAFGALGNHFLALGIPLTEGATNAVPPGILGVPVQVVLLSLWALSNLVFLYILTRGARK